MQMPKGQVVETIGKDIGTDLPKGAHIQFPHPIAFNGLAAAREKMPHGNNGETSPQFGALGNGRFAHLPVVVADTLHQLAPLVLKGFTGLGPADIAVAQIGNGADDQLRFTVGIVQHHQFVFRRLGHAADHVDIEEAQHLAGGIQQRGRIVVARRDHHVPAPRAGAAAQKAVVELQRPIAGRAVVEDITGHQQRLDPFGLDAVDQPVEKVLELLVAFAAIQSPPDVPIRCMQDFHVITALCFATQYKSDIDRGCTGEHAYWTLCFWSGLVPLVRLVITMELPHFYSKCP